MIIERPVYLKRLIDRQNNGMIKIVTGLRRCGKSYLLFELFRQYLLDHGTPEDHIIPLALDIRSNERYRDPDELLRYVESKITGPGMYYIMLDEVQMLDDFESVLNEMLHWRNTDIYVTGSNSKFLSTDILTEFRGRGDEVRVHPLAFSEYAPAHAGTLEEAWQEYFIYGGLPQILSMKNDEQKGQYLDSLFQTVYIKDIRERNRLQHELEMNEILDILASATGSLTNPSKLADTFRSKRNSRISEKTVAHYCQYLENAFLLNKSVRYDVKGKAYISTPFKYYFEDPGLRNARLRFRQTEENHIMENIIYNELRYRGYQVDVGVVEVREKNAKGSYVRKPLEIDCVANIGSKRCYVQSAFEMLSSEKMEQERRPFRRVGDSFRKIIVVREKIKLRRDEDGVVTMGLLDFLLDPDSLDRY